jgi:GNAT superfamily N-acetyltransferase
VEELTIRPIAEDERDELRQLVDSYLLELMPLAAVVQDIQRRAGYFQSQFLFDTPGVTLWWAISDTNKVGFARVDLAADHDGPWAEIRHFYIGETWRRHGYGRAFVYALIGWLRQQGVVRIDLHVRKDNPRALEFWNHVGFELASYRLRTYIE